MGGPNPTPGSVISAKDHLNDTPLMLIDKHTKNQLESDKYRSVSLSSSNIILNTGLKASRRAEGNNISIKISN